MCCVCFWARLLTYVRHWYLWESVLWFRPDLRRQMHLPGGSKGMCVWLAVIVATVNSHWYWVLPSSLFRSRLPAFVCVPVHVSVHVCHRPWVMSRSLPLTTVKYTHQLRWHLDDVQMIDFLASLPLTHILGHMSSNYWKIRSPLPPANDLYLNYVI